MAGKSETALAVVQTSNSVRMSEREERHTKMEEWLVKKSIRALDASMIVQFACGCSWSG